MNTGLYRHYKGPLYQVIGVGEHTETKERVVIYVSLTNGMPGPRIRVRPLDGPEGWNTPVTVLKQGPNVVLPDGKETYLTERFKYIGDELE